MAWSIEKNGLAIEAYADPANLQALPLHPPGIKRATGMRTV